MKPQFGFSSEGLLLTDFPTGLFVFEVGAQLCAEGQQTLSNIIWRHFLHPEDKSLSPNGEFCNP
jgi:hypothetical protein